MRFLVCLLLCSSIVCFHVSAQAQSPAQAFQQAKNTYTFGDYAKAVKLFRALLYPKPGRLQSKFMQQQAHQLLGISYYYLFAQSAANVASLRSQGKPAPKKLLAKMRLWRKRSRFELLEFLASNPDATLSPLIYPPGLVSFFNKLKAINKLRLNALKIKKTRRKLARLELIHTKLEKRIHTTSPFAMLLPCGFAQMANGHTVKGILVLVGCTAALATNLTAYGVLLGAQREGGRFETSFVPTARVLRATHFVAFGTLAALVIYGYIDGIYFYARRRESITPELPKMSEQELGRIRLDAPPPNVLMREQFR